MKETVNLAETVPKKKRKSNLPFIKIDKKLNAIIKTDQKILQSPQLNKLFWKYIKENNLIVKKEKD